MENRSGKLPRLQKLHAQSATIFYFLSSIFMLAAGCGAPGEPPPPVPPVPQSFRVVDTVPGALVARHSQRGQVPFVDPVSPSDPQLRSGQPFVYRVRTRLSAKRSSPDSKDVSLHLYSVPERIASLEA